jgi:hypothetical protein
MTDRPQVGNGPREASSPIPASAIGIGMGSVSMVPTEAKPLGETIFGVSDCDDALDPPRNENGSGRGSRIGAVGRDREASVGGGVVRGTSLLPGPADWRRRKTIEERRPLLHRQGWPKALTCLKCGRHRMAEYPGDRMHERCPRAVRPNVRRCGAGG